MKTEKIIGIMWLIFGIVFLFLGINNIYNYSSSLLWYSMTPIEFAYSQIIYGILSLLIGLKIIKHSQNRYWLVLYLAFLLVLYTSIFLYKYGFSTMIYYNINNFLLILTFFTLYKLRKNNGINSLTKYIKENKLWIFLLPLLCVIPFFFAKIFPYNWFSFLH